jgi:hypothetical protein
MSFNIPSCKNKQLQATIDNSISNICLCDGITKQNLLIYIAKQYIPKSIISIEHTQGREESVAVLTYRILPGSIHLQGSLCDRSTISHELEDLAVLQMILSVTEKQDIELAVAPQVIMKKMNRKFRFLSFRAYKTPTGCL